MNTVKVFQYQDAPIQFDVVNGQIMANATAMCKVFGKNTNDIFKTKQWQEFEQVVSEDLDLRYEDIRYVKQGGNAADQGTWIHEELVIELARRLNPAFALWCNRKIAELHRAENQPKVLSPKELALLVIQAEEEKERLLIENNSLKVQQEANQPKVEFYDAVTDSNDVADLGKVAKVLNVQGVGRTKLFAILRESGVLRHNNEPYQEYVDRGWFRVIETSWATSDGSQHVYFKTVAFQKGIDGIRNILKVKMPEKFATNGQLSLI